MSDANQNEWHRLFNAALNGTLTAEENAQLAALLKTSPEARQLWFLYHDNECGLAELKPARAATENRPNPATRRGVWSWSPLTAAAAGLVFGLFSASVVWGYVGTFTTRAVTLLTESFEQDAPPLAAGMPVKPGFWSGDFTEIVSERPGVKPAQGSHMLRFQRADYEGKPVRDGYVADLFRIVDLRGGDLGVARGDASIQFEVRFNAIPQADLHRISCGVTIYALDELPPEGTRDDTFISRFNASLLESSADSDSEPRILATTARRENFEATGKTWQPLRAELRLPSEARYCLIHLRAHLNGSHRPEIPKPVEFAGLFVDDIRLSLTHRTPLP